MLRWPFLAFSLTASLLIVLLLPQAGRTTAPANALFERTWARTDRPVLEGQVSRTWMWSPEAFTGEIVEPYAEAPGGQRTVQYFDKARMEDNSYRAAGPPWDVTNGLLVVELITGRLQAGDDQFQQRSPAAVNVAGDSNDPDGPTYASLSAVLDAPPANAGATLTKRIARDGTVIDDPSLASHGVIAGAIDDVTNHAIAMPFWNFMNSSGLIYDDGQYVQDRLFDPALFATGRPVTEAYWANVLVAGTERLVLLQCFERRCLTYTVGNPAGFLVEAGNVGQHYYAWRYGELPVPATPTAATMPPASPTPTGVHMTATPTVTASATATAPPPATEYQYVDMITAFPDRLSAFQALDIDPAGNIYVLQGPGAGESWVHRFTPEGDYVLQFGQRGVDPGQIDRAAGIAVDASGHVFVSDFEQDRIVRYTSNGNYQLEWGENGTGNGEFRAPEALAVDSQGLVYVAEWNGYRIQVFDADGNYVRKWGSQGSGAGQFERPNGIAIGRYEIPGTIGMQEVELVFVSDAVRHDIQVFTTSGVHLGSWGTQGTAAGQFDAPDGIDIDSTGDVYVVDSNNNRVQHFRPTFSISIGLDVTVGAQFVDQWGSLGSVAGQFDHPMGLAVSGDDRVYVIDWFNDRVQIFDRQGTFLSALTETRAPLATPYGVAATAEHLYIAATDNRRIVVFDTALAFEVAWFGRDMMNNGDSFDSPYGVDVDPDGAVYVADLGADRVAVHGGDGAFIKDFTVGDRPTDLALDSTGNVYVIDYGGHQIVKYTVDGEMITRWGEMGSEPGQFDMPWSIAVYGGEVFVTDRGNHRVQVFDPDGTFLRAWGEQGSSAGAFEYPAGIALDTDGYVYVADTENHRIQKFDREGRFITSFGGNGSAAGQFERPFGVALDADGRIYVADTHNNRIQVFAPVD